MINSIYVVTAAALQAGLPIRSEWHSFLLVGDPQGRSIVAVRHIDDPDEAAMRQAPGVAALPHVLNPFPLPAGAVAILQASGIPGITAQDTIATALEKMRSVWPKAAAIWR